MWLRDSRSIVYIDDIAANEVAALFDRADPKDFVDVYFLSQEVLPFSDLVERARQKHVGMDDYWLAQALARARTLSVLPRMVRPLDLERLRSFFVGEAERLMRGITG